MNSEQELLYYNYLKPKGDNFIEKINSIREELKSIIENNKIDKIICEEPSKSFKQGMSSAQVITTIFRFNGIIHFLLSIYNSIPTEIPATTARKKILGRGTFPSGTAKIEVYNFLKLKYKDKFPTDFPVLSKGKNKGQPTQEVYDVCDAWIVALSGIK